jgi:hypothetical protein
VVILTEDIPEEHLTAGMKGAIVHILHESSLAYEVEFVDSDGRTTDELALRPDQLEAFPSKSSA